MALLVGGYAATAARLGPQPVPPGWAPGSDPAGYTAVFHVHSAYSHDGQGSVEEIAAAATRQGIRVVLLTDHNTLVPLAEGKEGWYGDTLVLIGAEVVTEEGTLLLLDPKPDTPVRARGWAQSSLFARYRQDGAIVILAHPDHPRLSWRGGTSEFDGLEVVDLFDQVARASLRRQVLGLLAYPVNPRMAVLSVVERPPRPLALWDQMARDRPTFGILGLDAHGGVAVTDEGDVPFPSHETLFGIGRLHFVAREPLERDETDRRRVYRALRAGQFYNAFDGLAPAAGFRFEAHAGREQVALMGAEVRLREDLSFEVHVPPVDGAWLRLLRDGAVLQEGPPGLVTRVPVDAAGVYRVEVDLQTNLFPIAVARRIPWIFANPIYVRP